MQAETDTVPTTRLHALARAGSSRHGHGTFRPQALRLAAVTALLILIEGSGSSSGSALAQATLPAPSRTAFKCEVDGKVSYSDSPCLGAKKVELEPTRGLSSSPNSKAQAAETAPFGTDVHRERQREGIAQALRPLTGMDAKQFDTTGRRLTQLSPEARQACERLDRAIPLAEETEARASKAALPAAQEQLLQLRRKFRELRC